MPALSTLIFAAGLMQLSILVASAQVPFQMDWKSVFTGLPKLHRQLYWVYGGYVVLAIVANGVICLVNSEELAQGSLLARSYCAYAAVFWGVRVSLQPFLDVKSFLKTWWLTGGYHLLTVMFLSLTVLFAYAAVHG